MRSLLAVIVVLALNSPCDLAARSPGAWRAADFRFSPQVVAGVVSFEWVDGALFASEYGEGGTRFALELQYGGKLRPLPLLFGGVLEFEEESIGDLTSRSWGLGPRLAIFLPGEWLAGDLEPYLFGALLRYGGGLSLGEAVVGFRGRSTQAGFGFLYLFSDRLALSVETAFIDEKRDWEGLPELSGSRVRCKFGLAGVFGQPTPD